MNETTNMKQTKPFSVRLTDQFKALLVTDAKRDGKHYGIYFSTSGKALVEQINPTAHYQYIFRTDNNQSK